MKGGGASCVYARDERARSEKKKEKEAEGRFTRYDFVACDKLTTVLRHEFFRVNQTYNSLTTVVYVRKNVVRF